MADSPQLEFFTDDILADVPHASYTLTGTTVGANGEFVLTPTGSAKVTYTVPVPRRFACANLKVIVKFSGNGEVSANYAPKGFVKLNVKYAGKTDTDNNLVMLNRDSQPDPLVANYINDSVVATLNSEVESITVTIINKSSANLTVTAVELYKSKDLNPLQIVNVMREPVITADVLKTVASFSGAMFTQYLQTNLFSFSALKPLVNATVHYFTANDWTLGFYSADLDPTKTKQLVISYVNGEGVTVSFPVWRPFPNDAIAAGDEDIVTFTDPRTKYPSMNDMTRDKYRYMVFDTTSVVKKFSLEFVEVTSVTGVKTMTPALIFGAGSNPAHPTWGKGILLKDFTGFHMQFDTDVGLRREIIMDNAFGGMRNMHNPIEYTEEYDDGWLVKFKGDPAIRIEAVFDVAGVYLGVKINGGDLAPYSKKVGKMPV